jgi:hypothetical protein
MKLCEEELFVIKEVMADKLETHCVPSVVEIGAKTLAYAPLSDFDDIDVQELKWIQIILRKIINKLVEINGN